MLCIVCCFLKILSFKQESLRLNPSAGASGLIRVSSVDLQLPSGHTIPKNAMVFIPLHVIHRDPEHWPEPNAFKPER